MTFSAASPSTKIRATYMLIILCWIGIGVGVWFIAGNTGRHIASAIALSHVKSEVLRTVSHMNKGEESLEGKSVDDAAANELKNLVQYSNIAAISLFNGAGKLIWTSNVNPKYFSMKEVVAPFPISVQLGESGVSYKRVTHQNAVVIPPEKDKGFLANPDQPPTHMHSLAIVTIPLMKKGILVGAIQAASDVTAAHEWAHKHITFSAKIGALALLLTLGFLAWLLASYNREKICSEVQLKKAYDEVQQKGQEARVALTKASESHKKIDYINSVLNEKIRTLRQTQEQLVKASKMALLGKLTATVAHELRNPLVAVRTSAFIVKRKCMGKVEGIERPLARIEKGIERCTTVITELLDFSHTGPLNYRPVKINDWIVTAIEQEAKDIPTKIRFVCILGTNDAQTADIDVESMRHVLYALFHNASEAMSNSEPVTKDPRIQVTTALSARGIEVVISDNGPGIEQENIDEILEPLFTTKSFGVGLGLPTVMQILNRHNGGLEIDSEPGKGASFTAWFPVTQIAED